MPEDDCGCDCPTQQDLDDAKEEVRQEFEEKFEQINDRLERLADMAGVDL
jgi:hypothetical protein